jgi:hypothetical protein
MVNTLRSHTCLNISNHQQDHAYQAQYRTTNYNDFPQLHPLCE